MQHHAHHIEMILKMVPRVSVYRLSEIPDFVILILLRSENKGWTSANIGVLKESSFIVLLHVNREQNIEEHLRKALIDAVDNLEIEEEAEPVLSPPPPFIELRNVLADVYSDSASMQRVAEDTGVKTSRINFQTSPLNTWHFLLKEACYAGLCKQLKAVVLAEYPKNKKLREAFNNFKC